jgi:hypothetical protein
VNFSTDSTRTTSEGQLHLMAMQDSMTHMRLEGENKGNECQGLVQSGMGGSLIRIQSSSKAYDGIYSKKHTDCRTSNATLQNPPTRVS